MADKSKLIKTAYDELWRSTSDMTFVKDLNGVYVDVSQKFAEKLGYSSPDEIIGKTDLELFGDPEFVKRYTDDDARLLKSGGPLKDYIEPFPSRDGRPRYCLSSKYIIRDEDGNPTGFLGVSRDITAEYETRRAYENELRMLFDFPPDAPAAVLFDITEWRVVDACYRDERNQVVSRYSDIDDYFRNVVGCVVDDEGARDFFLSLTKEFFEKRFAEGRRNHSLEYLRRMPDGSERWVRDEFHLLLDPVNNNLSLIIILRDIDAEKREYSSLVIAAEHDALTGLLNRSATTKCIESYIAASSGTHALFMIDLDNFKMINDSLGHRQGDKMLSDAAAAIRKVFRSADIVGRLGGDEFMALMKDIPTRESVEKKATELISALQFSSGEGDNMLELTTSVGVSVFASGEQDFGSLYGEADTALYRSKMNGKNCYTIFDRNDIRTYRGLPAPVLENVNTEQLRALMEYMDGGVIMAEVSDDIKVTYVSPSLYRSFGRRFDQDSNQKIFSTVHPSDLPGLRAAVFEAAKSNDLTEYPYRVVYDDRTEWRSMRCKRIPDAEDGVSRVVAAIADITGMKRANDDLRDAEERYRTAAEQTEALLWEVDIPTKKLTLIGTAWGKTTRRTGIAYDVPDGYVQTGRIHEDFVDTYLQMIQDMFNGDDSRSYFYKVNESSGEETWIKDRFKLIRDEDGNLKRALGATQMIPNINAEMHSFEHEMKFVDIVKDSLLGYLRVNLTANALEEIFMKDDERYEIFRGMSYDFFHTAMDGNFVYSEDCGAMSQQMSREYNLELFRLGGGWRFIDYRHRMSDGSHRWVVVFIKLMRHPISGDVYAFGYFRDNELRRGWELSIDVALQRDTTMLLYTRLSMEILAKHIFSTLPTQKFVAVSVIEMVGLDAVKRALGEQELRDVIFTFGRLCRIAIGGDVVVGQLDEDKIVVVRADSDNDKNHRERIKGSMAILKEQLAQAHPDAKIGLVSGFAVEKVGGAVYAFLGRPP
ncbi:MAG: diguanylate cyclase [Synergistaceae bacterium]|nr:diguanylate cyclase [Synergistaceae bacterium]